MKNVREISAEVWRGEDVPETVQEDINEAVHQVILAKETEHDIGVSVIQDIVVCGLEGVVIPEEESEELRARAARDEKTFQELVIEYVNRSLEDDAAFDRAERIAARNEGWDGNGGNAPPTLTN
ncbi:MAG: hypothetical protein WB660_10310 [Candidatus Sulfotelmatobacter sp.]